MYVKGQLVTNLGITPPDCRAPHGSQPITTYSMPPTSPQVGSLAKDKVLTLALSLPLRNLATLQAKIDAAADPASPTYRQWLTPADRDRHVRREQLLHQRDNRRIFWRGVPVTERRSRLQ